MAGDPHWASVVLAMHMDGVNAGTVFTDSKNGATVTATATTTSTTQSKFGGASALFNGTTSQLVLPLSADFLLRTGDFTIEMFVRIASLPGGGVTKDMTLYGTQAASTFFMYLDNATGALKWFDGTTGRSSPTGIAAGVWTHVAATRSSATLRLFVDGFLKDSLAGYTYDIAASGVVAHRIGGNAFGDSSRYFNGHIGGLRITKGVARYTAAFTPPVAAFLDYAGQLSGAVKDDTDTLCARTVRAYLRSSGALVGSATSNAATGAYTINTPTLGAHTVMALDDVAGTQYNALVLDHLTPA